MKAQGAVLIVGGGGHALVTIEVLHDMGVRVLGALTREGRPLDALRRLGVEVLGTDQQLASLIADGAACVFVAVGHNQTRRRLSETAITAGGQLAHAISPDAVVSPSAHVASGALVMPGAVINALSTIGTGAIVNTRASIDHECEIRSYVHVAPGAAIAGGVSIGDGALVGIGASVLPGRTVGPWSTVGAGAVVVHDVPGGVTVTGVPARPMDQRR